MHHSHNDHPEHRNHSAHDEHASHSVEIFRSKFWLSLVLTIPTVLYSHTVMNWLNLQMPGFPGSNWLPAALGTVIFLYGGVVFLKGAKAELATRRPGMMTLISIAISVSFAYSLAVSLGALDGMDF